MKFIFSMLRNIRHVELPKYLGRWKIEYCDLKINNKVDLANLDHCGVCGNYSTEKLKLLNEQIKADVLYK